MIRLEEIKSHYPPKLHVFPLGILRECIQYNILEAIYSSKFSNDLVFMGGTALRIAYDNQRFSEDLDFDNLSISKDGFEELSELIKRSLELEGYEVEIRNVYKDAFHCYIKIPEILQKEGLSNLPNQKITIRIDTTPQDYSYKPNTYLLDNFGVYQNISIVSVELLMAQKFAAILGRKRAKGRDYFDISYLFSKNIEPDMTYIKEKLAIKDKAMLVETVLKHISNLDMSALAVDVKPFLFNPRQSDRVSSFEEQLSSWNIS